MAQGSDFWSAWTAAWVGAVKTLFTAQRRFLEMFQPPQVPPLRRGQPSQSAAAPPPRRRGPKPRARRRS
jgi:hypothetical protein